MHEKIPVFYPKSVAAWRKWLEKNHLAKNSVWLVFYNKNSSKKSISWSEAVDVALCFGWIDSKKIRIDEETSHQFFSRRKPKSTWSKINKEKITRLTEKGLMTTAGIDAIETAKLNGYWYLLDEVEELVIPKDLDRALKLKPGAKKFFQGLGKSVKKSMLQWLVMARRPETRQSRVSKIAELASQGKKPKQF